VKKLEEKKKFKKRMKRSPDDGDGFVMAVAPDFLFARKQHKTVAPFGVERESPWH
jgi:hypothetical protein